MTKVTATPTLVHPYVNGEVSYKNPTEDFSFEGTVGRVDVKAVYDRACQASIYKKGTVSDFPGYKHVFPELSWLYSFETKVRSKIGDLMNCQI